MDYLKSAVPSQLAAERGSNIVVINPGSSNIRIGLAQHETPFSIPHCIARHTTQVPRRNVQDQLLNSQITTAQHVEREKAYDVIASLMKIPFLDDEVTNSSFSLKMVNTDGQSPQIRRKDMPFTWTNVVEDRPNSSSALGEQKFRDFMCGEDALKISPTEPYCLRRPIRRGHFNVSLYYPMQQVIEDLHAIWEWILSEKLNIPCNERNMYSAILIVSETFDTREIKELLSIIFRDLCFNSAVVYQEGLAAIFGNGLSTACVVNIGAQTTTVICVEDGVALPLTQMTLPFGGEDISRCFLWTQRHHQTWPPIRTDPVARPIDLLMLNKLKETYCHIREGELDCVTVVHSYEDEVPPISHRARLTALNVPPMGLFYPCLLVPDVYPSPPRTWFQDYEDVLEDSWHMEFQKRPDTTEGFYPGLNSAYTTLDNYPVFPTKSKKEDVVGLAEAVTDSILSTRRIDLERRLFCSIQLIGGVALTNNLMAAVEERVLNSIPPNEAIDTVEVLPPRLNPSFVPWKGGTVLGILDMSHDTWIRQEDWINSGIHVGSGKKYKDSYFVQAQATCYVNSGS